MQVGVNYTVSVSADNLYPSPGDTVNFTVKAGIRQTYGEVGSPPFIPVVPPPIDLKVGIELTNGLTHNGSPSFYTKTCQICLTVLAPGSATYRNREFIIGTGQAKTGITSHSMTLPLRVSSDSVVNEQCLTARLTGNPPPGTGRLDEDISDNMAKLCLGVQLPLLMSEQVDAFTIYQCVGNTDPPCDTTDDVRVRAVDKSATQPRVMGPGEALVHVPDRPNREFDSHANSVNAGTEVSWQIPVIWNADNVSAAHTQWTNISDGFTASGTTGGSPPGRVHIRAFEGDTYPIIYKMTPDTTPPWAFEDTVGYDPTGTGNGPFTFVAEFEKLGTYKIEFTAKLTRAPLDGDEDCDPDTNNVNQRFCATETYTFHVGPMAGLEVKATPAAGVKTTKDQVAFTVTATHHGPDIRTHGVRVPVTLPAGMKFVRADSDDFVQDNNNPQTGVWDIGELKVKGFRQSLRQPESETLTIVAELTGDVAEPVRGSIKSQDYCVRIKSSGTPDDDLPCDGSAVPTGYTEHSVPTTTTGRTTTSSR